MNILSSSGIRKEGARAAIAAIRRGWYVVLLMGLFGAVLGLGASLYQDPVYRSSATLYVTSGSDGDAMSAYQGSLASQQRVSSYALLVSSDSVIARAIDDANVSMSKEEIKDRISAAPTPDTVLLTVSADDTDSLRSAVLANAVARSMVEYVASLEAPVAGGAPLAKLTIVSPAIASSEAVAPRTTRNIAAGFLVGVFIGTLCVMLRTRLNTKIAVPDDLADFGLTLMGTIPSDRNAGSGPPIDFHSGVTGAAEAFRRLRTNMEFAQVDSSVHRILVTSASESEGKSTTAMNLAAALAEAGKRVILVDADLRRPSVAGRVSVSSAVGLTDYLRRGADLAEVIQQGPVGGLDVLASGQLPPNPAELLGSNRAADGFAELGGMYDYVIVDSPPVLPVTDSAVIAQWVDGCLVVVRSDRTKAPELSDAVSQLRTANSTIIGVVLNGVDVSSTHYRYGYYGPTSDPADNENLGSEPLERYARRLG